MKVELEWAWLVSRTQLMRVIVCLLVELLTSVEDLRYGWRYWILRLITAVEFISLSNKRIPLCLGPTNIPHSFYWAPLLINDEFSLLMGPREQEF